MLGGRAPNRVQMAQGRAGVFGSGSGAPPGSFAQRDLFPVPG